MSDRTHKNRARTLLDDVCARAMAASEDQLKEELRDAGIDPEQEIAALRSIAAGAIEQHRRAAIDELPDTVPEDPAEVRALLDRLLAMPQAPAEGFTLAYRDKKKETSARDLRVLTENLLKLIKQSDRG